MIKKQKNMANRGGGNEDSVILSQATPIRIGLVFAFLTAFGSAIFWGASITAKLDSILSFQSAQTTTITELKSKDTLHDTDIGDLKLRISLIEVEIKAIKNKSP